MAYQLTMNLFFLDREIDNAVKYHCDKHVVKMCLETAQLLCTGLDRYGIAGPYKPTHKRHPTALWTGDSIDHYLWLRVFGLTLCREYTWRYRKVHASANVIETLPVDPPLPDAGWTDLPQAMPDKFKGDDPVVPIGVSIRRRNHAFLFGHEGLFPNLCFNITPVLF